MAFSDQARGRVNGQQHHTVFPPVAPAWCLVGLRNSFPYRLNYSFLQVYLNQ